MYQDICLPQKCPDYIRARRVAHVYRDAGLVGVEIQEETALFGMGDVARERTPCPDGVARGGFELGTLYFAMNELGEARSCLERARSLEQSNVKARVLLSLVQLKLGDEDAAQAELSTAWAIDPAATETFVAAAPALLPLIERLR